MLAAALAAPAWASDGVIEINHARALAGGVSGSLAADPAGYPVRITQPGSYRLTSDLAVPNAAAGGIVIAAGTDDVTLDLGGFTIRGVSSVVAIPPTWACTLQGTGMGVRAEPGTAPATARNVVLKNGAVRNFGNTGIDLSGDGTSVRDVDAEENCGRGISGGQYAQILSSRARRNLAIGIACDEGCRIADSVAIGNGDGGLRPLADSLVADSAARDSGGDEIRGFENTLVVDSEASDDAGGAAIRLETGALVLRYVIRGAAGAAMLGDFRKATAFGVMQADTGAITVTGLALTCQLYESELFACP